MNTELEINALELLDSASPANPEIHNSLVSLYNKFSALQRQSACKWAQRARLQWVQDGDHNTGFFHNCVRFRKHVNSISHILDANGNVCFGHQGIEQVFVDFYSKLWSESDPKNVSDVCFALPDDLISLSDCDADFLVKDVSKNEVFQTLISLPSGKSPGPDGLNVEFYRFFWDVVGDHLFDDVSYFFNTSSLPASWGRTYVTLIPKKPNPKCVSDFRPISLCNVSYKVISKLLANRLKHVLPKLIGREQCGFVSGRNAFDNIIALQEIAHSFNRELVSPLGC